MRDGISRDSFPTLHGKDAAGFAKWLVKGFQEYSDDAPASLAPFDGAHVEFRFERNDHITDDLAGVYHCLNSAEQSAFRDGLVRAISALSFTNPEDTKLARNFIHLAFRIDDVSGAQRLDAEKFIPALDVFSAGKSALNATPAGREILYMAKDLLKLLRCERPYEGRAQLMSAAQPSP